jgi:hypothetical protein
LKPVKLFCKSKKKKKKKKKKKPCKKECFRYTKIVTKIRIKAFEFNRSLQQHTLLPLLIFTSQEKSAPSL